MSETSTREETEAERMLDWQTRLSLVLSILFVGLSISLAWYAYERYSEVTEPENMVMIAENKIQENWPEVRRVLKKNLIEAAPEIARELDDQVELRADEARERLVQVLRRQMAWGLDEATVISADEFREFVRANKEWIVDGFEMVEDAPQETEQFVRKLENQLDKKAGIEVRENAKIALKFLEGLNDQLDRLTDQSRPARAQDLLELQMLRIVKTLQVETVGEVPEVARVTEESTEE